MEQYNYKTKQISTLITVFADIEENFFDEYCVTIYSESPSLDLWHEKTFATEEQAKEYIDNNFDKVWSKHHKQIKL